MDSSVYMVKVEKCFGLCDIVISMKLKGKFYKMAITLALCINQNFRQLITCPKDEHDRNKNANN